MASARLSGERPISPVRVLLSHACRPRLAPGPCPASRRPAFPQLDGRPERDGASGWSHRRARRPVPSRPAAGPAVWYISHN